MHKWLYKTPNEFDDILMRSDGEYLTGLGFIKTNSNVKSTKNEEEELVIFKETSNWLDIYFGGKNPNFKPRYKIANSTAFRSRVIEIMTAIPFGQTLRYKDIAAAIVKSKGLKKMSSQAVGGAVGWNPIGIIIPCHRVIGSNDSLTGYSGGIKIKQHCCCMSKKIKKWKNDIMAPIKTSAKKKTKMRKHYLDNIRWLTIILVLIYHVFYLFNSVGVLGGMGGFAPKQSQDVFLYIVYPWFMVLFFVVAGMSSRYALATRTNKQFLKERTMKLLVPSTLGLLVYQWIGGYFNLLIGGAWQTISAFLKYPLMVLTGTGPLWFIQMLWLFSIMLIIIKSVDKKDKLYNWGGKCNLWILLLLFLPVWGAAQILNVPVITTYRFGIYLFTFLIGYFVFSHDEVMEKLEKVWLPLLLAAGILGVIFVGFFFGKNYTEGECLQSVLTNLYLWITILAVLGGGKKWLNQNSAFTQYMTKASFGIYIVHYPITLAICYGLKNYVLWPTPMIYVTAIVMTLFLSVMTNEVIRRIPIINFLVLGVKKT